MPNKSSPHGGFFVTGTISHGTLRPQDLLRAFAAELNRLMPFNSFAMTEEARGTADILDGDDADEKDYDSASAIIDELVDELNVIAQREGNYYFGNTEGDGSDFGFWSTEDGA
jgi:hypothetical protein